MGEILLTAPIAQRDEQRGEQQEVSRERDNKSGGGGNTEDGDGLKLTQDQRAETGSERERRQDHRRVGHAIDPLDRVSPIGVLEDVSRVIHRQR
jgi:hypothetical protein